MKEVLNRRFIKPYALDEKQKDVTLSLMIGTEKERQKAEAKGPSHDRRNKWVTWRLWLPYGEIIQNSDQVGMFINKFFEAVEPVLVTYGIKAEDVEQAKDEVKKEVVGNDHYSYAGAEIPPPDLSGIKF